VFAWAASDSVAWVTNRNSLAQGVLHESRALSTASTRHVALAAEAHGVFASLHSAVAAAAEAQDDAALRTALLRASTHYRALLVAHLAHLRRRIHRATNNRNEPEPEPQADADTAVAFGDPCAADDTAALVQEHDLVRTAHLLWHAAELFCLGAAVAPSAAGAPLLLQWLVANHTDDDADARDVEHLLACHAAAGAVEREPSFWPLVERLAIRGRAHDAAALLGLHSSEQQQSRGRRGDASDDAVLHVRELLLRLPLATAATHSGDVVFLQAWRAWQRDCASLRQASAALRADAGTALSRLFAIMCGDLDVIERAFTGYELLGALMTFVEPCASPAEVARHARRAVREQGLDGIVLTLLQGDTYHALAAIEQTVPQVPASFLDAHLTDLLWRAGVLESYDLPPQAPTRPQREPRPLDTATRLREARILRYVDALASSAVLASLDWSLLCTYWRASGAAGESHALLRLARAKCSSTRDAARLVGACEQFGAAGAALASRVRAAMGIAALRRGRAGDAVRWLMASGDAERLNAVAALLLERFATYSGNSGARHTSFARELRPLDDSADAAQLRAADVDAVLSVLGDSYMFSGKISFLSDYRRLHALWEAKDFAAYAALTVSLLRADVAPQRFWITLLLNCLPLLEHDSVVFDVAQTRHLMRSLNELECSHRRAEYLDVHETDLAALSLALTRNLARAVVQQEDERTTTNKNSSTT
jgi:hypothetical protein